MLSLPGPVSDMRAESETPERIVISISSGCYSSPRAGFRVVHVYPFNAKILAHLVGLLPAHGLAAVASRTDLPETSWIEAMELRHWKDDSNPYALPRPLLTDKLPSRLRVALC